MKKVLFSLVTFLCLLVCMPVSAEEQVPVYMFSKDGCSACISAQSYFAELENDYPELFELKEIVVFDGNWNAVSDDRTNLLVKVYERFGEDSSKAATPTIVIGDYHTVGLPQDTDVVYDAIVDASKDDTDVVKELIDDLKLDLDELLEYEAVEDDMPTTPATDETSGKYDTIIIIGIFVVLIGGLAGLVVAGKK